MTDPLAKLRDRKAAPTLAVMSKVRSCDGCDVCCTAPGISDPKLTKAPAVACSHLAGEAGRSCTIYENRPRTCRLFFCLWRAFDHVLPDWQAPKDCGFALSFNNPLVFPSVVTVHPMPDQPLAWMTLWHQTVFAELAIGWNCIVAVGQSPDHTVAIFAPDGSRFLKADHSPERWASVCRDDGTVGVPSTCFGPDRRPLIDRIWETGFKWGIAPQP